MDLSPLRFDKKKQKHVQELGNWGEVLTYWKLPFLWSPTIWSVSGASYPSPNQHQGSKTWSRSQILRCRMIFTCFDNLSNRMQPCLVWSRQCNISMWKRSPLWYTHIGLCHPNKSFMMLKPAHRWNSTPWYPATTCNWLLIIQIFDHIFLSLLSLFWGNDLTLAQGIHSLI